MKTRSRKSVAAIVCMLVSIGLNSCKSSHPPSPEISFTVVPVFGQGTSSQINPIQGTVRNAQSGQKVVLYAKSGDWWVQPLGDAPFTTVQKDSCWKNRTHPGLAYAALLVSPDYHPRLRLASLPQVGGPVLAVTSVENQGIASSVGKTVLFAGYEWQIRSAEDYVGANRNLYRPENVWLDRDGFLHLKISGTTGHWTSAEADLSRSLGYGTYRFVVRGISRMDLAAVFTMMTWANEALPREMDIEISKWGETFTRNGQFVIQPYHMPANTVQFECPKGTVTFMLRWAPGRATFKAFRGATANWDQPTLYEHLFTSGVPEQGNESVHLNLYVFDSPNNPLRHETEVMVEAFDYLP